MIWCWWSWWRRIFLLLFVLFISTVENWIKIKERRGKIDVINSNESKKEIRRRKRKSILLQSKFSFECMQSFLYLPIPSHHPPPPTTPVTSTNANPHPSHLLPHLYVFFFLRLLSREKNVLQLCFAVVGKKEKGKESSQEFCLFSFPFQFWSEIHEKKIKLAKKNRGNTCFGSSME